MPITKTEITRNKLPSQYQTEEISSSDKRRLIRYISVDNQFIPNPEFDLEFFRQYQERSRNLEQANKQECLKKEAERTAIGGRSLILEAIASNREKGNHTCVNLVPPRPRSHEEALRQSKLYIETYRDVSKRIDNPKYIDKFTRINLANKLAPWSENKLARANARKKQNTKAKLTPLYTTTHATEESVLLALGELRSRRGKNMHLANSAHALITELFLIGNKGSYLQVGIKHLAKRLGMCSRQINRALAYLEKLGLIVRHGAHLCTNIYQLSVHFSSEIVRATLAAFAVGVQWHWMRDVAQKAHIVLKSSSININRLFNINKKTHKGSDLQEQPNLEGQICEIC